MPSKEYYATHRDELREKKKLYDESHKDERQAYRESNKEKISEYNKNYRDAHGERHVEDMRKLRAKWGRYTCECGVEIANQPYVIAKHFKTPSHIGKTNPQ